MVQYKENKDKMAMLSVITADGQSSAWAGLLFFKKNIILTFIISRLKVANTAEGSVEEKYKTWCKEWCKNIKS